MWISPVSRSQDVFLLIMHFQPREDYWSKTVQETFKNRLRAGLELLELRHVIIVLILQNSAYIGSLPLAYVLFSSAAVRSAIR